MFKVENPWNINQGFFTKVNLKVIISAPIQAGTILFDQTATYQEKLTRLLILLKVYFLKSYLKTR